MRFPEIRVDYEATDCLVKLAEDILGDLLTVRVRTQWWWSAGLTMRAVFLRGLQQLMHDLVVEPDNAHRLMSFLRDGMMALVDYVEENDLLFLNNDGTYVGSGGGVSRKNCLSLISKVRYEPATPGELGKARNQWECQPRCSLNLSTLTNSRFWSDSA